MLADGAGRPRTKVHIWYANARFLGPLCAWAEEFENAGICLSNDDLTFTIQGYEQFEAGTAQHRPGQLSMFMSRKDSFESAGEEDSHNAMLRGVRKFLEKLHQLRQCAVMDHDVVLALSEDAYNCDALPVEPSIVMLHKQTVTSERIPAAMRRNPSAESSSSSGSGRSSTTADVSRSKGLRLDPSYFLNLAEKTHTWPFGAVAELIHNSSDADAKEVRVSLDELGPEKETNFVVIDNGTGMTHSEMDQLFTVGKNYGGRSTAFPGERIGCNGVGFQQGVLRLGHTAAVVSVCGKQVAPNPAPGDAPTASFGVLSIEAYHQSASETERQPVVTEHATLNLSTMQADARFNTPEEYDRVMDIIHGLVPYFTREYLVAYAARFVVHTEGSAWDVCGVKSSTSIFVSKLKLSKACCKSPHKLELIRDDWGSDIRLEDHEGKLYCLPTRPPCSNAEGLLRPPMDYSLRSFCELMFLGPRMKIFVQGSEVSARGLLSSPCDMKEYGFRIDRLLHKDELSFSRQHRPLPYKITVRVVLDRWHHEKGLSGIMVYFENCLVDSYSRGNGSGLARVVPREEAGYLAIVSFRGPADKRIFHPNPTKVGFPDNNEKYAYVMKAAGEALTQVIHGVPDTSPLPNAKHEDVVSSIECCICGEWRIVTKAYHDEVQDIDGWHCGIENSPVPFPANGSNKCSTTGEEIEGDILNYSPSTLVTRTSAPRDVLSSSFSFNEDNPLGTGSSACVYVGAGVEGDDTALKVFDNKRMWTREKDILWALQETGESHQHICRLAWVCEEALTIALKPLRSRSLGEFMTNNDGDNTLKNHERLGIMEKVADALTFLHSHRFSHNDVQPSNIVLGENPTDDVLLVDFGQASVFSYTGHILAAGFDEIGQPLRYAPPEVLRGATGILGGERDMFSFGVTVVELFSEQTLFSAEAVEDEAKLRDSLETLGDFGDLKLVDSTRLRQTLPGLMNLAELPGMKKLALICRSCLNGDLTLRSKADGVFRKLTRFKGKANFNWRHGSSIVYHTLEPGDQLNFSEEGEFVSLTRLPCTGGSVTRENHIKNGSKFDFRSQFVSCSLAFSFCVFYAQKQNSMFNNKSFGLAPILEIDLAKLSCDDFEKRVFDGTRQGRAYDNMSMVERFAADAEEVILEAEVSRSAVKAVYNLDYNPRKGESTKQHNERACHLVRLQKNISNYAFASSSPFGTWEKHYNKLNRQRGEDGVSHQQRIKNQARVPDENGEVDRMLRSSYCAQKKRSGGSSSSSGGGGGGGGGGSGGGGRVGNNGQRRSGRGRSGGSGAGRGLESGDGRKYRVKPEGREPTLKRNKSAYRSKH